MLRSIEACEWGSRFTEYGYSFGGLDVGEATSTNTYRLVLIWVLPTRNQVSSL
jgi:hypothetical protein